MKLSNSIQVTVLALAGLLLGTGNLFAAGTAKYPAYSHALADLRAAKTLLEKDGAKMAGEKKALHQIDLTIAELSKAKLEAAPAAEIPDAPMKKVDRFGSALRLLAKAEQDVLSEKNEPSMGIKHRTEQHLKAAYRLVKDLQHVK